jgi:HEAT repeat protein
VADACLWCAQSLQAKGKRDQAIALYDRVRKTDAPRQIIAAATRGAILARQSAGVPMLVEQIKSTDKAMAAMALSLTREMPGTKVTQALVAELKKLPAERRILLMEAIADRRDAAALPAIVENAKSGDSPARVAAIKALGQLGNASVVPMLFDAAADADAEVANAAKTTLATLPGRKVDAAVVAVADKGDAKVRRLAIEVAGQRRIVAAREAFFKAADDSDKALRLAAIQALGEVGSACDVAGLVAVLMSRKDPQELGATEQALGAVCGRAANKPACADKMLASLSKSEGAAKCALLRVLRVAGGAKALEAVRTATKDSNADIQEAAFRSLCDWPTADAAPDLLALAKSSTDAKRKILALRGYINLIKDKDLTPAKKLAMAREASALIQRPDEKRLLLGSLGSVPSAEALAMVMPHLDDAATKSEAVLAGVSICEQIAKSHPAEVNAAIRKLRPAAGEDRGVIRRLNTAASQLRGKAGSK